MQRQCESCGKQFTPRQSHHRKCPDCFRQSGGGGRRSSKSVQLPDGYLAQGYFDPDGHIHPDLITSTAEEIAKRLGVGGVTANQLRRFYTKAKTAEQRLKAGEPFPSVTAGILELKQHAANAVGRAQGKNEQAGLELLKQFIDRNVDLATKSEEAFRKGFLPHFQGVVGYFKYHNPKK